MLEVGSVLNTDAVLPVLPFEGLEKLCPYSYTIPNSLGINKR